MSSYDKVVKLACKPKAAPPKAKYLDMILAATWSEDGAIHDVCKALAPRFREPNAIVVFKALIVLHTMIRNGATDNVLAYLSTSEVLRLRNVSAGNWDGYNTPQNLQHYAIYLDTRIKAYRDLKHDAVRVQAESNRDMRNDTAIEEDNAYRGGPKNDKGPQRSKTVMGRKLRSMTVEKGLLRETKVVQRMTDSLIHCRFYLDDLGDELTITALRMLVKDLLILFQAGNEGVINVLEHYFEMSKVDAESALAIYRHFCKQTEMVVEYLAVANKLQNLLNVSIPNLKHAPVSLAGALEEYIKDPNFEQNRLEYKANKQAAGKDGSASVGSASGSVSSKSNASPSETKKPEKEPSSSQALAASSSKAKSEPNQAMQDFLAAIEEEQPTMFNPQTGSPTVNYFQQQATHNPFGQFGAQPTGIYQQMQQQPTEFIMPQQTALPQLQQSPNPFASQAPQQQQHRPFSSFLLPQATGFPQQQFFQQPQATGFPQSQSMGLLQPQTTGLNPFRQSALILQMTGGLSSSPFGAGAQNLNQPGPFQQGQQTSSSQFSIPPSGSTASTFSTPFSSTPFSSNPSIQSVADLPIRPSSTPLTTLPPSQSSANSPPEAQPVKSHQTGSRNPFGVPVAPPPPVPKAPTLMELYLSGANMKGLTQNVQNQQPEPQQQLQQPQQRGSFGFANAIGAIDGKVDMASVASEFSFKAEENKNGTSDLPSSLGPSLLSSQNTAKSSSTFSDSVFSSLSGQPTGATATANSTSLAGTNGTLSPSTLQPQTTGFPGMKAFKPTSNFGTSLLDSLPPISGSDPNTPGAMGSTSPSANTPAPLSAPGSSFSGSVFGSQPTGALNAQLKGPSTPSVGGFTGTGLRPQMTGGAANPFRASIGNPLGSPMMNGGSRGPFAHSNSTGAFGGGVGLPPPNGHTPFGAVSGGEFSPGFNLNGSAQNGSNQQQQNGSSLI